MIWQVTNCLLGQSSCVNISPFVITQDGDIDYVAGGKMEMVYHADNQYFEFLDQWLKELHMERTEEFIESVFRA